jgi:hypothetical protein
MMGDGQDVNNLKKNTIPPPVKKIKNTLETTGKRWRLTRGL